MSFVRLVRASSETPVLVNVDNVLTIEPRAEGSVLLMMDGSELIVLEGLEELEKRL